VSARLNAVENSKQAYTLARTSVERRLREAMKSELANLQTQVDIAVRYAYDSGESKASILRALHTKNWGTVIESLERTAGVTEIKGVSEQDKMFKMTAKNVVLVTYKNHGPSNYSGSSSFAVKKLDDGKYLFISESPLWNEDFSVRNDVVAVLDGVNDNFYYEELSKWILETG
jgi:hypothetical protein